MKWVKNNQVLAFIITAFLLSWCVWLSAPILGGGEDTQAIICCIGAFGPSAAAVIISILQDDSCKGTINGKAFIPSFLIIYALAVLTLEPVFQARFHLLNIALFVLPSAMAAALFALAFSRHPAAEMLKSLVNLKVPPKWYAFSLLLFPAAVVIGVLLDSLLSGKTITLYSGSFTGYVYLLSLTFVGYGLFGGPLNEEIGWRGFAMPRLLRRFRPLAATLNLGGHLDCVACPTALQQLLRRWPPRISWPLPHQHCPDIFLYPPVSQKPGQHPPGRLAPHLRQLFPYHVPANCPGGILCQYPVVDLHYRGYYPGQKAVVSPTDSPCNQ